MPAGTSIWRAARRRRGGRQRRGAARRRRHALAGAALHDAGAAGRATARRSSASSRRPRRWRAPRAPAPGFRSCGSPAADPGAALGDRVRLPPQARRGGDHRRQRRGARRHRAARRGPRRPASGSTRRRSRPTSMASRWRPPAPRSSPRRSPRSPSSIPAARSFLDALPYPADPLAALADAAAAGGARLRRDAVSRSPIRRPPTSARSRPSPQEFQGDLSYDPTSRPAGAEAWAFVRGEDLALRVVARAPAGRRGAAPGVPRPLDQPRRALRSGDAAPRCRWAAAASSSGVEVRAPSPGGVALLRLERAAPGELEEIKERVTVTSERDLPVEEILRRLQAFEDAQARRLDHYQRAQHHHACASASAARPGHRGHLPRRLLLPPRRGLRLGLAGPATSTACAGAARRFPRCRWCSRRRRPRCRSRSCSPRSTATACAAPSRWTAATAGWSTSRPPARPRARSSTRARCGSTASSTPGCAPAPCSSASRAR